MKSAKAKCKASLKVVATKNAERKARAAKTQAQVPNKESTKVSTPKQMEPTAPVPAAVQDEAQHSQHQFPDPRDAELWDARGITEALWKMGEEEEAVAPDNVYIPLTVSEMVANLMTKLKELTARDRTESAKIIKFKKRIESEDDEDILAEVKGLL